MINLLIALALQGADRLPPAGPVSAPPTEEAGVLAPVYALFEALEAGDAAMLLRHVYPDGRVTAVGTLASGSSGLRQSSWTEYAARMKLGGGFRERITDPAIEVDGDVALVWAPFTIEAGGKIVSCGYDHFDLVRQAGVWKVMNISFSTRVTGCPGQ